jgi:cyclopropane fatty-acyl-phospholipid synthase-like methyltransferase
MTILHSAPAERNVEFILEVLQRHLPPQGEVLEVASGTGQHVMRFSAALPELTWQPTDPDPSSRASISARLAAEPRSNVREPVELDVKQSWPGRVFVAVVTANLLHISPYEVIDALFAGASGVLAEGGIMHVYGPFKQAGEHTSQSNVDFDQSLRGRNPLWGIRDMEDVVEIAQRHGFTLTETNTLPANNFSIVFRL